MNETKGTSPSQDKKEQREQGSKHLTPYNVVGAEVTNPKFSTLWLFKKGPQEKQSGNSWWGS